MQPWVEKPGSKHKVAMGLMYAGPWHSFLENNAKNDKKRGNAPSLISHKGKSKID